MLVVFTGNGKGKTTAALGQAMRALGRGKRVLMIQFIKGPWISGEDEFVKKLKVQREKFKDGITTFENLYDFEIKKMGLGFVGILGDQLPKEEHAKAARQAFDCFEKELKNDWDMIVLDELSVAVSLGLLDLAWILEIFKLIPKEKIVVVTGRDAPQELIDAADLVTEMREVKHPFAHGKLGTMGIEF